MESFYGKKLWMTLVFASILLAPLMSTNQAFAHGDNPSTCNNRYDGPITSAQIIVGNQTFDPIANPGVTFELATDQSYTVTFIIRTPSQSSQGNSLNGTTWYRTDVVGFGLGVCVPDRTTTSIGPDQNVTINDPASRPSTRPPSGEFTQTVNYGTLISGFSYTVNWICPSTWNTFPCPPYNLSAIAVSSSQINLSWTAPRSEGGSPITGYQIDRSVDNGFTWSTIVANTGNASTSYSDTGLAHSTTYTYRVSAINSVGTSSPSNTFASATTFHVVPSPPTGLTATGKILTATGKILQIDLNWNSPSDDGRTPITGYKIERSTDGGNTWSTIVEDTGNTDTAYSDTDVLPLTTYTYRVSAINAIGTSDPSNTASAEIPTISILPLSVQQLDLLEVL